MIQYTGLVVSFLITINADKATAALAFRLEETPANWSLSLLIWTGKIVTIGRSGEKNETYLGVKQLLQPYVEKGAGSEKEIQVGFFFRTFAAFS